MNTDYKCVTTVDGILEYIGDSKIVAFDFETAPDAPYRTEDKAALDPARSHICGCSFSIKEGTGIYVPIAHLVGENIDKVEFFDFLSKFLTDKTVIKIAHNIAFESSFAYKRGIVIQAPVYDTICASQMSLKNTYDFRTLSDSGLKRLAGELCGEELPTFTAVTDGRHFDELDGMTRRPCATVQQTLILLCGSTTSLITSSTDIFQNTGTSWRRWRARLPCTSAL